MTIAYVELIAKERDRLLQRTARAIGLGSTVVALVCLVVPGVIGSTTLVATLPLFAILILGIARVGASHSLIWVLLGLGSGLAIMLVVHLPIDGRAGSALGTALVPLAAGALASFAIVLTTSVIRIVILVLAAITSIALVEQVVDATTFISIEGATVALGWVLLGVFGYWLSASVPRAAPAPFRARNPRGRRWAGARRA